MHKRDYEIVLTEHTGFWGAVVSFYWKDRCDTRQAIIWESGGFHSAQVAFDRANEIAIAHKVAF